MIDNIKEFLKYYIGCDFVSSGAPSTILQLTPRHYKRWSESSAMLIKPILSRLSDITEENAVEIYNLIQPDFNYKVNNSYKLEVIKGWNLSSKTRYTPELVHYLINKQYWMFGDEAFEKGLVIDRKTLKNGNSK